MSAVRPDQLLARVPLSPDLYLHKIDLARHAVLAIEFAAEAYRSASFLDDRVLTPATRGGWLAIEDFIPGASAIPDPHPVHFIFHTGHVGSTLVSRLLDETGRVLPIREPLILRNLAEAADRLGQADSLLDETRFKALLQAVVRCWGRGYPGTQYSIVKATSSASRLWRPLLQSTGTCALWLNLRAEPYIATLLAGQNSPIDLRGHAPERMRRLQSTLRSELKPLHAMTLGELAAMSWVVETLTQHAAMESAGRVLSLDFDEFLRDVTAGMRKVLAHFAIPDCDGFLASVESSEVLTRYSKAVNLPYSAQVRAEVLLDSRQRNAQEIRAGMNWLAGLAQDEVAVAQLSDRF